MSKFLDDHILGPAIADLMAGAEPRCAVAFWGTGASELFQDLRIHRDAKIVCDLTMGGTNPNELTKFGAPANEKLRHLPGLHAKIYLSAKGLITSSANASNNGIGFHQDARLVEAGTFHPPDSDAYQKASLWFDVIWNRAGVVDVDALDLAKAAWARSSGTRQLIRGPGNAASLFDAVIRDPSQFRGVGFAFTIGQADKGDRDAAADFKIKQDEQLTVAEKESLSSWSVGDVFSGWEREDIFAWPQRFVCAHRPRKKLTYWFYERSYTFADQGIVFAKRLPKLKGELGLARSNTAMQNADSGRAEIIFGHLKKSEHRLYENGEKLVQMLDELGLIEQAPS